MFIDCPQLVELKLDCVDRFERIINSKSFPELKSLTLDGTFMVDAEEFLRGFLDNHKNLTTLRLCRVKANVASISVLQYINENLQQLQILHLTEKYYREDFESLSNGPILSKLRHLKELRLFCGFKGFKPIEIEFPKSLEHLHLDQVELDKYVLCSIASLSNLHILHLIAPSSKMSSQYLFQLKDLKQLSELYLQTQCTFANRIFLSFVECMRQLKVLYIIKTYVMDQCFYMRPKMFENIVDICQNRNNNVKLTIITTLSCISELIMFKYQDGKYADLYTNDVDYDHDYDEDETTFSDDDDTIDSDDHDYVYHSESDDESLSDDRDDVVCEVDCIETVDVNMDILD